MIARGLTLVAALLLALVVVAGAGLAAFAYLPLFAAERQALAARLLERLVDRPVAVEGPVTLAPGRLTAVTLGDIRLGDGGPESWRGTLDLREARFAFATLPALMGRLALDRFEGSGMTLELDGSAEGGGAFRLGAVVRPIARFLASPLADHVLLEDVRLVREAGTDGWSSEVVLTRATADTDPGGARQAAMAGTLNDRPFTLDAAFAPPAANAAGGLARRFKVEASVPGIDEVIEGELDIDGETLSADVTIEVEAIGDLLETLRLKRQLEGSARLRLSAKGPIDTLAAENLRLEAQAATGETVRLDGRIDDLSGLTGVELAVTADLRKRAGGGLRPVEAFDVEVTDLSGRVTGSLDALAVTGLAIRTTIASADLADIGPVGVERVTRDEAGRLGLQGLTIKSGDPAAPSLDLAGRVEDLLGGAGIELAGQFDLDLIALATGRPGPAGLGRLAGQLALSDAGGKLRLTRLDAGLAQGGPVALTVGLPEGSSGEGGLALAMTLDIPDLDALATSLDAPPLGGGSAAFAGTLEVVDDARVFGRGHVGDTSLWLDLQQDVVGTKVVLEGAVKSPHLVLADLPRIAGLAGLATKVERNGPAASPTAEATLEAVLDTEARIMAADGTEQGRFDGRLTVKDGEARLDPLSLAYLGGTATATLSLGLEQDPPPARLDAQVKAMDTGALLTELGTQPLLAGALDATLRLTARGKDAAAVRGSLGGEATLSMGEGRIGTRLIDLTAQNVVSWLFSTGRDTRLVCAAARLQLSQGLATIQGLVLRTENVELVGGGSVNLGRETLDLAFDPRPARGGVLQAATPFRVHGPLKSPEIELRSAAGLAGRAVVETVTLPFNILGSLFGGSRQAPANCTLDQ